jgi:undecaprenyl-diphosphatase
MIDTDPATALAIAVGSHATAWFLAGLCAALVLAAALWHHAGRRLRRDDPLSAPSPARLLFRAAAGFTVIVATSAGFAWLAAEIGEGGSVVRFDETLARTIAVDVGRATLVTFAALTRLGDPLALIALGTLVAAALAARGRRLLAVAWIAALAGSGLLNYTLKLVFERVRPVHQHGLVEAQGWSFPSGHSSGAVVAYGMLAYVLIRSLPSRWHMPVVVLATAAAFAVGSSRVFLQVHFASDVIAGFLSGAAWLAVSIASIEAGRHYRRGRLR